jgi:hypothetical protein
MEEARLDLTKVFLQFNKLVLNAMGMERQLVKLAPHVEEMEKLKVTKMFLLRFQKVLMMVQE